MLYIPMSRGQTKASKDLVKPLHHENKTLMRKPTPERPSSSCCNRGASNPITVHTLLNTHIQLCTACCLLTCLPTTIHIVMHIGMRPASRKWNLILDWREMPLCMYVCIVTRSNVPLHLLMNMLLPAHAPHPNLPNYRKLPHGGPQFCKQ